MLMSVVTVILFTFFVPGVVVTFNKNKTMAALLHGVLFAIAFSFVHTYVGRDMEGFANTITCKGVVRLVSNNPSNHATRATSWTCPAGNTCGGAAGSCIAPAHADALSSALNNAGNFVTSALNK
jgi:hypothetical protein